MSSDSYYLGWDDGYKEGYKDAKNEYQPSAQSEIIRCKDCKWWDDKPLRINRRCSIFNVDTDMAFYCKHGRRTDE